MTDKRLLKYNVDFCFRNFKYSIGAVTIDLENLDDMKGRVIAPWTIQYATEHLIETLLEATGVKAGWHISEVQIEPNTHNNEIKVYNFTIKSRLYSSLRKIYDKR